MAHEPLWLEPYGACSCLIIMDVEQEGRFPNMSALMIKLGPHHHLTLHKTWPITVWQLCESPSWQQPRLLWMTTNDCVGEPVKISLSFWIHKYITLLVTHYQCIQMQHFTGTTWSFKEQESYFCSTVLLMGLALSYLQYSFKGIDVIDIFILVSLFVNDWISV